MRPPQTPARTWRSCGRAQIFHDFTTTIDELGAHRAADRGETAEGGLTTEKVKVTRPFLPNAQRPHPGRPE